MGSEGSTWVDCVASLNEFFNLCWSTTMIKIISASVLGTIKLGRTEWWERTIDPEARLWLPHAFSCTVAEQALRRQLLVSQQRRISSQQWRQYTTSVQAEWQDRIATATPHSEAVCRAQFPRLQVVVIADPKVSALVALSKHCHVVAASRAELAEEIGPLGQQNLVLHLRSSVAARARSQPLNLSQCETRCTT